MKIKRILCTGDFHMDEKYFNQRGVLLGEATSDTSIGNSNFKVENFYPSLLGIINTANSSKIDMVVILGDLFGIEDNHYSTILERLVLSDFLSRINKPVFIMYGNHEINNDLDIFGKFKNVTVINDYMETDDFKFLSYPINMESKNVKLFLKPSNKVLFTHAMFSGAKMGNGFVLNDSKYGNFPSSFEKKPGRIIIAGHVHSPQSINNFIFYTGSADRLNFGEIEEKSFIILDTETNKVERVPLTELRDLHLYKVAFKDGKFVPTLPDKIPPLSKIILTLSEEDITKIPYGALAGFFKIEYVNTNPKKRRERLDMSIIKSESILDKCSNYLKEHYKKSDINSILNKVEEIMARQGEKHGA